MFRTVRFYRATCGRHQRSMRILLAYKFLPLLRGRAEYEFRETHAGLWLVLTWSNRAAYRAFLASEGYRLYVERETVEIGRPLLSPRD